MVASGLLVCFTGKGRPVVFQGGTQELQIAFAHIALAYHRRLFDPFSTRLAERPPHPSPPDYSVRLGVKPNRKRPQLSFEDNAIVGGLIN